MTEEEKRKRLRYLQLKKKQAQAAPSEPEMSGLDTARGAIEAINQGTTLGFGDEIAGWGRAAVDKLTNTGYDFGEGMAEPEERSIGDTYEMYRDDQRNVADDFSEANTKTAMALELAGGLASPINVLGPWAQATKGAGVLKSAGQLGARGAVEGAIAGAGGAENFDDPLQSIGGGALTGGVLGGGMGGLGRAISKRSISQELGKGKDFVPIHMTEDDTLLTDLAREGLGRVGGAASKLRNQEKAFLETADSALEKAVKVADDLKLGRGAVKELTTESARKQAQESISESALELQPSLWRATEAENFKPRKVAKALKSYWGKDGKGFSEVKGMKFDTDDELTAILKKHFPEDDVAETMSGKVSGKRLMDLRNEFAVKANKGAPSKQGAEQRAFKEEIDNWMKKNMEGGLKGVDAQRYADELKSFGEYQAFRRGLPKDINKGEYLPQKVAAGRGSAGELGEDFGQARAEKTVGLINATKEKAADSVKAAREVSKELHRRSAPKASGLSELFTTRALGSAVDLGVRGLTLPAGLGLGQALASPAGQRTLAGQTFWQKALQDDEKAKLLAQMLRQSISRQVAGE